MLSKRIIACLDVDQGHVVKGVKFKNHRVVGSIEELAAKYCSDGIDELVFYDISASPADRTVDATWIQRVAKKINIPFCVAGGIRSVEQAEKALWAGADKISVNSPALSNPELITQLAERFGSQSVVVGIDSYFNGKGYEVFRFTGCDKKISGTGRKTFEWMREAQDRGAGEIVLNCMNQDGVRSGYDLTQLAKARELLNIPLVASGGCGSAQHFVDVFKKSAVDAALAASVFHYNQLSIPELKKRLFKEGIGVRL